MEMMGAEFMMEDVPIRLEYLAAYIRKYVDWVEVIDLNRESRPFHYFLHAMRPDLVGITANYMSVHNSALELAEIAKLEGIDVVIGGYQATAMADELAVNPNIDFVVRGEGEATLLDIVQKKPLDTIQGISFSKNGQLIRNADRPLIEDLDTIPFPERALRKNAYNSPFMDLESDGSTAYDMIISSRGCFGKCKFCTEPLMSHGVQRYRRPEKVVEELREIVKIHQGKKRLRVSISDPNFGGSVKVAEELCDRLIDFRATCDTDLHFFISVRTSTIANHKRLAKKMVKAGMDYVFVGMESPKAEDLQAIAKAGCSREKQELAAKYLEDSGAAVMSNFLLGLPGQTEQDILGLVDYAKSLDLTDCYFSVMIPLPGSKLYDEAKQDNLLLEEDFTKYRLWDTVIRHDKLSRSKIRELCIRCNAKWYDDLLLQQEYRRYLQSGARKKKLHVYAGKFKVLAGFLSFIGTSAGEEFADLDPAMFVMDMPNPRLRKFTQEMGIHNMLEMGRFLKILGKQKIQVRLQLQSQEDVSWVAKTGPKGVEYLDAINGSADDLSIAINIPIGNGSLSPKAIIRRILKDNPDFKSRLNLTRLFAAAGSEIASYYLDKTVENIRCKSHDLVQIGRSRMADLAQNKFFPAAFTGRSTGLQ
jgi:anaerobic magnesium-protoporphyrin IX monomethyl ester cyclase